MHAQTEKAMGQQKKKKRVQGGPSRGKGMFMVLLLSKSLTGSHLQCLLFSLQGLDVCQFV